MDSEEIVIYGKDSCPYTKAALEDHQQRGVRFRYVNVVADPSRLEAMLAHTGGRRLVPVIVKGGEVTVGFGGT